MYGPGGVFLERAVVARAAVQDADAGGCPGRARPGTRCCGGAALVLERAGVDAVREGADARYVGLISERLGRLRGSSVAQGKFAPPCISKLAKMGRSRTRAASCSDRGRRGAPGVHRTDRPPGCSPSVAEAPPGRQAPRSGQPRTAGWPRRFADLQRYSKKLAGPIWPHGGRVSWARLHILGNLSALTCADVGGQGRDRTADLPLFRLRRSQKRDVGAGQARRTRPILRVQSTQCERRGGCGADEIEPVIGRHGWPGVEALRVVSRLCSVLSSRPLFG